MSFAPEGLAAYACLVSCIFVWGTIMPVRRQTKADGACVSALSFSAEMFVGSTLCLVLGNLRPASGASTMNLDGATFSPHALPATAGSAVVVLAGILLGTGDFLMYVAGAFVPSALGFPIVVGTCLIAGTFFTYVVDGSPSPLYLFLGLIAALAAVGTLSYSSSLPRRQGLASEELVDCEGVASSQRSSSCRSSHSSVPPERLSGCPEQQEGGHVDVKDINVTISHMHEPWDVEQGKESSASPRSTASPSDNSGTCTCTTAAPTSPCSTIAPGDKPESLNCTTPTLRESAAEVVGAQATERSRGQIPAEKVSDRAWVVILVLIGSLIATWGPVSTLGRSELTAVQAYFLLVCGRALAQPLRLAVYCRAVDGSWSLGLLLRDIWRLPMKDKVASAAVGVLTTLGHCAFFLGSETVNAAAGFAISNCAPLWTTVLGALVLGELKPYTNTSRLGVALSTLLYILAVTLLTLSAAE